MPKQACTYIGVIILIASQAISTDGSEINRIHGEVRIEPTEFKLHDLVYIHAAVSNVAAVPVRILRLDRPSLSIHLVNGDERGLVVRKHEWGDRDGFGSRQSIGTNECFTIQFPLHEYAEISQPGTYEVACELSVDMSARTKEEKERIVICDKISLKVTPRTTAALEKLVKTLTADLSNGAKRGDALNQLIAISHPSVFTGLAAAWQVDSGLGQWTSDNEKKRVADALIGIGDEQALGVLENLMTTTESSEIGRHVLLRLSKEDENTRKRPSVARIWKRGVQLMLNDPSEDARQAAAQALKDLEKQ